MSRVIVRPGDTVTKDPNDIRVYVVDWDGENLPAGVELAGSPAYGVFTITCVTDPADVQLTKDNEAVVTVDALARRTRLRLTGGTDGYLYNIANRITTNESPAQTKEYSFNVLIQTR